MNFVDQNSHNLFVLKMSEFQFGQFTWPTMPLRVSVDDLPLRAYDVKKIKKESWFVRRVSGIIKCLYALGFVAFFRGLFNNEKESKTVRNSCNNLWILDQFKPIKRKVKIKDIMKIFDLTSFAKKYFASDSDWLDFFGWQIRHYFYYLVINFLL